MIFNKKQGKFLLDVIDEWVAKETVSQEIAASLRESFTIRPFDWKRLAKYSFWVAIICFIIALASILADRALIALLEQFFTAPAAVRCLILAILAAGIFYLGLARRRKHPERVFSNEAIFFIGVLFCSGSIAFLGEAIDTGSGHFSLLFLLATFVYGILAITLSSKLIWAFSILSLGSWFGTETGYKSGWGAYYLGMNFPMRFVLFGIVLTGISFWFKQVRHLKAFSHATYVFGLLYLFIALWILSIFGNYGDMSSWSDTNQIELLHWGLLFALAAIAAIAYGLKYDDATSRGFGITFLFLNLYTKYFEFFWDATHKAVFFLILAISFWLIGSRAEKIWNLEFLKLRG
ncbi:MAG: hypothetical protein LBE81_12080 [Azonexus sp.]|jgi:hypothetical protein|uniref:hypothetical protein n=1 Tax=Azonexus sp. TaxID=1872668 RepID=UPI00282309A4|nr:hypothetical protein [Azonexus sp.]MDR0777357.1 hypothetical protein [Azonexus sp.]